MFLSYEFFCTVPSCYCIVGLHHFVTNGEQSWSLVWNYPYDIIIKFLLRHKYSVRDGSLILTRARHLTFADQVLPWLELSTIYCDDVLGLKSRLSVEVFLLHCSIIVYILFAHCVLLLLHVHCSPTCFIALFGLMATRLNKYYYYYTTTGKILWEGTTSLSYQPGSSWERYKHARRTGYVQRRF